MNSWPEYESIFRLIPDEDYLKFLVFDPSVEIKGRYLSRFSIIKCRERCDDDKDNQTFPGWHQHQTDRAVSGPFLDFILIFYCNSDTDIAPPRH
ncbi:MAG: hypothetical protein PF690_12445, partial [Deltaproteobacteria bacterium]|nr:hypothetical protein [Deltaproteobacteria bacterium]